MYEKIKETDNYNDVTLSYISSVFRWFAQQIFEWFVVKRNMLLECSSLMRHSINLLWMNFPCHLCWYTTCTRSAFKAFIKATDESIIIYEVIYLQLISSMYHPYPRPCRTKTSSGVVDLPLLGILINFKYKNTSLLLY